MKQENNEIIRRTNISSGVVINQSDIERQEILSFNEGKDTVLFITTQERGLSKSRNMALKNAKGTICLICDDDEILDSDYEIKISNAFKENPGADVIAFQIKDAGKEYPNRKKTIGYLGALKLASWQLAFKRKSIIENKITFDETLGSGVSKAGGEENKFLYDCLKSGLNIIYIPVTIGRMIEGESQWFHGFTKEYFYDRGVMTQKLMGTFMATLYAIYYLIKKHSLYKKDINASIAFKEILSGIYAKRSK